MFRPKLYVFLIILSFAFMFIGGIFFECNLPAMGLASAMATMVSGLMSILSYVNQP